MPSIAACSMRQLFAGKMIAATVRFCPRSGSVGLQHRPFEHHQGEPLRLASLAASCGVRNIATRALDGAGIGWIEVFLGGGMTAVTAAVTAGLAVGALAHRVVPRGMVDVGGKLALPPLPSSEIVLHTTLSDQRSRGALRTVSAAFREHRTLAL
jgi:DNA-binding transcriptional LysR family regulator